MYDQAQQRDYAEEAYWRHYCPECDESHLDNDGRCPMCPWCQDPSTDEYSDKLCRPHLAEYEGLSEDELDRRNAEEAKDLM